MLRFTAIILAVIALFLADIYQDWFVSILLLILISCYFYATWRMRL